MAQKVKKRFSFSFCAFPNPKKIVLEGVTLKKARKEEGKRFSICFTLFQTLNSAEG